MSGSFRSDAVCAEQCSRSRSVVRNYATVQSVVVHRARTLVKQGFCKMNAFEYDQRLNAMTDAMAGTSSLLMLLAGRDWKDYECSISWHGITKEAIEGCELPTIGIYSSVITEGTGRNVGPLWSGTMKELVDKLEGAKADIGMRALGVILDFDVPVNPTHRDKFTQNVEDMEWVPASATTFTVQDEDAAEARKTTPMPGALPTQTYGNDKSGMDSYDDFHTVERDWFFTFGYDHVLKDGTNMGDRYVRVFGTIESSRRRMHELFGNKWSSQYKSYDAARVDEYELEEYDI